VGGDRENLQVEHRRADGVRKPGLDVGLRSVGQAACLSHCKRVIERSLCDLRVKSQFCLPWLRHLILVYCLLALRSGRIVNAFCVL
jgi:hypothetical protein